VLGEQRIHEFRMSSRRSRARQTSTQHRQPFSLEEILAEMARLDLAGKSLFVAAMILRDEKSVSLSNDAKPTFAWAANGQPRPALSIAKEFKRESSTRVGVVNRKLSIYLLRAGILIAH